MRTEISREMHDPFSDVHLKRLSVSRKLPLQAGPNLIGNLIISQGRAQSHLIDNGFRRHGSRYSENLPTCRFCINLST
jgi:hypothetical protein